MRVDSALPEKIRFKRFTQRLSLDALEKKIDVSRSTLGKIERHQSHEINRRTFDAINKWLNGEKND